jgi:hypothetical protein
MSIIDRQRAVERIREETFGKFNVTEHDIIDPTTRQREYINIDDPGSVRRALARLSANTAPKRKDK